MTTISPATVPRIEAATMRRVAIRLVPFLMVCYFVSFVDCVNVGFAALDMVKDLHLSATVFGLGGAFSSFLISYSRCRATCCWNGSARGAGSRAS